LSEFASRLKNTLLRTEAQYITPDYLLSQIKEAQTTRRLYTIPVLAVIPRSGHQLGGSFLFFRKNTSAQPANMVRIPRGTFQMGSPANEPERWNDEVQHSVTVNAFYMGKYEVTQAEYEAVMGTNPSHFKGANLPVENVSWYDAVEFCNRLSQREGLTPAYTIDKSQSDPNNKGEYDTVRWLVTWNPNANGYRLPTEAEWEYAAKGGNGSPGNYTYSGSNSADAVAWYSGNSGGTTQPVGTKERNSLGIYDMSGNVWEWCWDWYGNYASGTQNDPRGPSGAGRVLRGGSWPDSAAIVRSAYRYYDTPSYRNYYIGFRLVRG
jgi:formylglycine-generating enzyme required for sulfatase activity